MRLRRADGRVYLDRWGIEHKRIGGVFLHKMSAPDPGIDLHDHPWWFASLILWGGYSEERCMTRLAPRIAQIYESRGMEKRGRKVRRRWLTIKTLGLDECHRITELCRQTCWTLVLHGPTRRKWGFYLPTGWMHWQEYDRTVRVHRRDLFADISSDGDPRVGRKS